MPTPSSPAARLFYRAAMQRLDDAEFLLSAGRTTAAVYLAGYSVECILKAMILAQVPRSRENGVLVRFRGSRAHNYEWLRQFYSQQGGANIPLELRSQFARVNSWSTAIRYSPANWTERRARAFLRSSSEIFAWGDGRLS